MTLELYQFPSDWDLPNVSPFCTKLETWLRIAQLDYVIKPWSPTLPGNGKAPIVKLADEFIPDSSLIIRRLTAHFDVQLDLGMSARDRALATMIQRTLEEHSYWAEIHARWIDPAGWEAYKPVLGTAVPVPGLLKPAMLAFLRRNPVAAGKAQGLHRHPPEEIHIRAQEDYEAVAEILGEGPYVLGEAPRSIDATVYAFLAHAAHPLWDNPARNFCRSDTRIRAYLERMTQAYWPTLERSAN